MLAQPILLNFWLQYPTVYSTSLLECLIAILNLACPGWICDLLPTILLHVLSSHLTWWQLHPLTFTTRISFYNIFPLSYAYPWVSSPFLEFAKFPLFLGPLPQLLSACGYPPDAAKLIPHFLPVFGHVSPFQMRPSTTTLFITEVIFIK